MTRQGSDTEISQGNAIERRRPVPISIICLIGFCGALFTIPLILSDLAAAVGTWYRPYLAFSSIVVFVCMLGLWNMKRWAVYAYTLFVAANQLVMLAKGMWTLGTLVIPAVVVCFAYYYVKDMD